MKKQKSAKTDIQNKNHKEKDNEEMDDLEFDEMNDVWDELDDLDI